MYLNSSMRRTLIIGGVSVLAVVGILGWTNSRSTQTVTAAPAYDPSQPVANQYGEYPAAPNTAPQPYAAYPNSSYPNYAPAPAYGVAYPNTAYPTAAYPNNGPVVYAPSPFGDEPIVTGPAPAPVLAAAPPPPVAPVVRTERPRTHYVYYYDRHHHRHHKLVRDVAIGAGGGAAIGAIAGGGKGAGIGAIAGAGAGYVWDKLHH